MRRRRRLRRQTAVAGGGAGHERWLVSYSDFMTLLLAFFVVMYSISQVSESKYRVLSRTLTDSFSQTVSQPGQKKTLAEPVMLLPLLELPDPFDAAHDSDAESGNATKDKSAGQADNGLQQVASGIQREFSAQLDQQQISMAGNDMQLEITFSSDSLFASGSARPSEQGERIFFDIAAILRGSAGDITVEGHTDNVPITSAIYPSNWELSAARAASVVAVLAEHGVDPKRLAVIGYGEYRPIGSNVSERSRMKNRRVVLIIHKGRSARVQVQQKDLPGARNNAPVE